MGSRFRIVLRFFIKRAKRVHDVVPSNDRAGPVHTQIWRCLYCAGVRRPGGQNRALLIQREVFVANHIHGMRKRIGRMQESVEIEDISFFFASFRHGPSPYRGRWSTRRTTSTGLMTLTSLMRLWNARWCGPCRTWQRPVRFEPQCVEASSLPESL